MATTGVTGGSWRADVTSSGSVIPWDGSARLDWYVAADDRWHDPSAETAVRQTRVGGSAVFETKLRIPSGDAVQRVWSVPDHGGITLIEVTNDSPLAIACAFTRADVLTTRPPTDVPIQGIELPEGTIVLPVGHRTSVTVGIRHRPSSGDRTLPSGLPDAEAVARGWIMRADSASRLELPDVALTEAVRAARSELMLVGPTDAEVDSVGFLLGVGELVRLSEIDSAMLDALLPDVAAAAERVAQSGSVLRDAALDAVGVVLHAADERRGLRDLRRLRTRVSAAAGPTLPVADDLIGIDADISTVARVEAQLANGGVLMPNGIPAAWLGQPIEAHGLITGPASQVSIALRWHGQNVAVLWEQSGDARMLSSGVDAEWGADADAGEGLWRVTASATNYVADRPTDPTPPDPIVQTDQDSPEWPEGGSFT